MTALQVPLSRKAMLVSLTIRRWNNRKLDEAITSTVAQQHGVAQDAGRYTKILIPRNALDEIGSLYAKARVHYFTQTLPWSDEGQRILPSKNYQPFTIEHHKIAAAYDKAADKLERDWAKHVAAAKAELNGIFDPADYPTANDMRARFGMDLKFTPFPDAEDFRVTSLSDAEVQKIREEIERNVAETIAAANRELWARLHEAITHLRDRLSTYTVTKKGKVEHPFRNTVVTNLQELVDLLPRLNVDDNPELDDMRTKLAASLCTLDPDSLREDAQQRVEAITDADKMLAAMAGYVGGMK